MRRRRRDGHRQLPARHTPLLSSMTSMEIPTVKTRVWRSVAVSRSGTTPDLGESFILAHLETRMWVMQPKPGFLKRQDCRYKFQRVYELCCMAQLNSSKTKPRKMHSSSQPIGG